MSRNIHILAGFVVILLLHGCGKAEEGKVPASDTGLKITDSLTVYHAATAVERNAVVPAILAKANNDIDRKGKSDTELAAEILKCMNTIDEQMSVDVRAAQPILDLGAFCVAQLGYKKQSTPQT